MSSKIILTDEDKLVISKAAEALDLYRALMSLLPEAKWEAISLSNPIVWGQVAEQQAFLCEIVKIGYISISTSTNILKQGQSRQEIHVLLILYKNMGGEDLSPEQIAVEIKKEGLEQMSDEELDEYRLGLIERRRQKISSTN